MSKFKSFSVVLEVTSLIDSDNGGHSDRVVVRNISNGQVLDVFQTFEDLPFVLSDLMDAVPLQSPVADLKAAASASSGAASAS